MLMLANRLGLLLAVAVLLLGFTTPVAAQVTYPPRIGEREFVGDFADLIDPADEEQIKAAASKLLTEQGIPLVVVTINSMADYGAKNWPIERYAMNLFAEWGIGSPERNAGVLLLVSKNDRKVRIEMGAAFTHERDVFAAEVINRTIIPHFKAGRFSRGILEGAQAIAAGIGQPSGRMKAGGMTGKGSAPVTAPPASASSPTRTLSSGKVFSSLFGPLACLVLPLIAIVLFMLIRRVGGGRDRYTTIGNYGPVGWRGPNSYGLGGFLGGMALGGLLGHTWGSRSSRSNDDSSHFGGFGGGGGGFSGGGFSGGSFGGGFSGGGGATGSW
jgi:uncharacterized membrane protein YgcG